MDANDKAYQCVSHDQDFKGNVSVSFSKDDFKSSKRSMLVNKDGGEKGLWRVRVHGVGLQEMRREEKNENERKEKRESREKEGYLLPLLHSLASLYSLITPTCCLSYNTICFITTNSLPTS